jgi:hypothetical protein
MHTIKKENLFASKFKISISAEEQALCTWGLLLLAMKSKDFYVTTWWQNKGGLTGTRLLHKGLGIHFLNRQAPIGRHNRVAILEPAALLTCGNVKMMQHDRSGRSLQFIPLRNGTVHAAAFSGKQLLYYEIWSFFESEYED